MNPRLLLCCLATSVLFAADGDDAAKVPLDVQKIEDTHDAAVKAAQAAFDQAVTKANAVAEKALDGAIKSHTAKGDLDGAIVARTVKERYQADDAKTAGPDPMRTPTLTADKVVGAYSYSQGGQSWQISLERDGSISGGTKPWEETTWKVKENQILIFTQRPTLWTKFEMKDGKLVNPADMSDCDWKSETRLTKP